MILLHLAVAALYGLAAWARWPRGGAPARIESATWIVPLALALHAFVIARAIFRPDGLDLSFVNALSLVAGLAALIAWASGLFRVLPQVAVGVLSMAAAGVLIHTFGASPHRFRYGDSPWAAVHIAIALVAYALFVVAALQALMLTTVERRLRDGIAASGKTPPLLTLERYLFQLVGAGFVLLTLALCSGFLFSEQLFGRPVTFTHKNVFSVAGWLAFAVLLFGRARYGWRGRTALRWIVGGTTLLVLGYLGSKFVSEVLLHR
ncbi:MAG: cytochrome c biogenesis protein CcsA [Casimicrobiaceae bacterium]